MSIEETNKIAWEGIQPDLFIASDEEEFRYALEVAREQIEGVPRAQFYPAARDWHPYILESTYDEKKHDVASYIVDETGEKRDLKAIFPDMVYYVLIPIMQGEDVVDNIAIQISFALWQEGANYETVMKAFADEGFWV